MKYKLTAEVVSVELCSREKFDSLQLDDLEGLTSTRED